MGKVTITQNKELKVCLKLDHSAMDDFCVALRYIVDQYCVMGADKSLGKVTNQSGVMTLLYEAILLDLYNRLIKQGDSPLRSLYTPSAKYSVKLTKAEALVYWAALNPLQMVKDHRPSLAVILNQIHKLLT